LRSRGRRERLRRVRDCDREERDHGDRGQIADTRPGEPHPSSTCLGEPAQGRGGKRQAEGKHCARQQHPADVALRGRHRLLGFEAAPEELGAEKQGKDR